ncbi:unnamed protein product [Allacma fusca]|uniref:Uncharacterized protein n=1 Tax=Allacma fusca TaxID=39272 RepID=A0A8J2PM48_9HEXA|nr:unnamed protein product [Allacma fusca]
MAYNLLDEDFSTPTGPMDRDEDISQIHDGLTQMREFEKKHRHPNVQVIYSFEDVPRKNLENYYYQILEDAMSRRCPRIIVEPSTLGVRIGQYINIGYLMHWFCIGSGMISIFLGLTFRHKTYVIYSCSIFSCLLLHASNLYYSKLQIAHYQYVENSEVKEYLERTNPEIRLLTDCPVVLKPYNPLKRRIWHHIIGCSAGIMMLSLIIRGLPTVLCRCPDGVIPEIIRYEGNLFEFFCLLPISIFSRNTAY